MSIAHSVVDQWVAKAVEVHGESLGRDEKARQSAAFVLVCARVMLDLSDPELLPYLTDGPDDQGIDLLWIDANSGTYEVSVTLFQGKFNQGENRSRKEFPQNELVKLLHSIPMICDPGRQVQGNEKVQERVAELRGFLEEGFVPSVRVITCSMGKRWGVAAQELLDGSELEQTIWEHVNPERLLALVRSPEEIVGKLQLEGPLTVEGHGFHRALVGRAKVGSIAELLEAHGEALVDRNVRRYLGAPNRVNKEIAKTLRDPESRKHFYFLNNGLTFVCSKLSHNQIQKENHQLRLEGLQLINGAQTAFTIRRLLAKDPGIDASVLVRVHELQEDEDPGLVDRIIRGTNSQSPVGLADLRANDEVQRNLEIGLKELGYDYLRQRRPNGNSDKAITPTEAAAAVLAVWRRKPHLARFNKGQHFGSLYREIFRADLTPQQVVVAVMSVRGASMLSWEQLGIPAEAGGFEKIHEYGRFHVAMRAQDAERLPHTGPVGLFQRLLVGQFLHIAAFALGPPAFGKSALSSAHRRQELAVELDALLAAVRASIDVEPSGRTRSQALLAMCGQSIDSLMAIEAPAP